MCLFKNRGKKLKVMGQLDDFVIINGNHYPLFSFTTLDGRRYEKIRNIPKDTKIKETSLEDVYIESGVEEYLQQQFPIMEIPIKYLQEDPTDFIPRWL